jgi:arsenate reductase
LKKVLVLCTGNSCRSIIAEALINSFIDGVEAKSSGVEASGVVNPHAKSLLKEKNIWRDEYHSKTLDTLKDESFDLVVTVCDNAKERCPIFPHATKTIHMSFVDPDGESYEAFELTYKDIKDKLLPKIRESI